MKVGLLLTALAGATILVGGCAVVPVGDPYYDAPVVRVAPPPPQYEYYGAPPVVGHIWIGGYWNWVGARYVWIPGRWEAPRPGYYWAPHRWERQGDHWRPHGGRWERGERPHVVVPPAPPPRIEHRAPPPAPVPYSPPRYEQRSAPQVAPPPPVYQESPRPPHMERERERESRRQMEIAPGSMPERRAEPPRMDRDERNGRGRDDRREDRRDDRRSRDRERDRDGDGRPDFR